VESFIEHQDACNSGRMRGEAGAVPSLLPALRPSVLRHPVSGGAPPTPPPELQLLPAATKAPPASTALFSVSHEPHATTTKLELSIGPVAADDDGREEVRRAMQEKAAADAERARAREEAAAAERALEEARRARQRARGELEKACALRDHAARLLAQVTCHACRQRSFAVVPMGVVAAGGDGHGGSTVTCESLRRGGGLGL
jgi:hypothetical protein